MKAVKAKKHAKMRKPQVKAMEGMQIVQLEKPVSDSESTGGMLDTRNIYQVCFCYSLATVNFHFAFFG